MSVSPSDLLGFAVSIAADKTVAEVGHRTAVCRAYYSAYHQSDAWYKSLPGPGSLGTKNPRGMHDTFFVLLSNPDKTACSSAQCSASRLRAYHLRQLHGCRTRADYDLQVDVCSSEAAQAIADAKAIIGMV